MGFRSPLFVLGLSAVAAVGQAGFRTPIPVLNLGSVQAVGQAGFRTPITVLNMGASSGTPVLPGDAIDGIPIVSSAIDCIQIDATPI